MYNEYMLTFLGLWLIILTIMAQHIVATVAHRKQKIFIPGVIDVNLDSKSFVFRSDRVFKNSLENIIQFIVPVFLAFILGVNNIYLAILVWLFAGARIGHMCFYYIQSRGQKFKIKRYFYLFGLFINIVLMMVIFLKIFVG
ncbi:MAG TPA: hypothetical protein DCL21_02260 [Alphaproteobacteria bacterium]|nr:hypothetical protein [Alphaproteobacteria bacterium]